MPYDVEICDFCGAYVQHDEQDPGTLICQCGAFATSDTGFVFVRNVDQQGYAKQAQFADYKAERDTIKFKKKYQKELEMKRLQMAVRHTPAVIPMRQLDTKKLAKFVSDNFESGMSKQDILRVLQTNFTKLMELA